MRTTPFTQFACMSFVQDLVDPYMFVCFLALIGPISYFATLPPSNDFVLPLSWCRSLSLHIQAWWLFKDHIRNTLWSLEKRCKFIDDILCDICCLLRFVKLVNMQPHGIVGFVWSFQQTLKPSWSHQTIQKTLVRLGIWSSTSQHVWSRCLATFRILKKVEHLLYVCCSICAAWHFHFVGDRVLLTLTFCKMGPTWYGGVSLELNSKTFRTSWSINETFKTLSSETWPKSDLGFGGRGVSCLTTFDLTIARSSVHIVWSF